MEPTNPSPFTALPDPPEPLGPTPYSSMADPLASAGSTSSTTHPSMIIAPSWRSRAHTLLNNPKSSPEAARLRLVTMIIIVLSTACFVLQSVPPVAPWGGWGVIDALVAIVFTVEYSVKFYVAPDGRGDDEYEGRPMAPTPCAARLRFMREPMSLIDLAAILPFWLQLVMPFAPMGFLQLLRAMRLVRILRMLRVAQTSAELTTLARCVWRCASALRILSFFLTLELLIVGGLVFHAERGSGPDVLSPAGSWIDEHGEESTFQSIPDGAWWCLVTVTTVGYGDQVPRTFLGKLIACFAMLSGLVGISTIISIIGSEMHGLRSTPDDAEQAARPSDAGSNPAWPGGSVPSWPHLTPLNARGLATPVPPPAITPIAEARTDGENLAEAVAHVKRLMAARRDGCSSTQLVDAMGALEDAAARSLDGFLRLADSLESRA